MSTAPAIDPERIDRLLASHPSGEPGALVDVLHDIQAEFRYLPGEALERAAGHLGVSQAEMYGVATFYEGFHLEPRGEHVVTICMGTACHVRGGPRVLEQVERELDVRSGSTTADLRFTLQTVNCVGACALGPLMIIDDGYHGNMDASKSSKVLKKLKKRQRHAD